MNMKHVWYIIYVGLYRYAGGNKRGLEIDVRSSKYKEAGRWVGRGLGRSLGLFASTLLPEGFRLSRLILRLDDVDYVH